MPLFPLMHVIVSVALRRAHSPRLTHAVARSVMSSAASGTPVVALRRTGVRTLLESEESIVGSKVLVKGWVRTVRSQKTLSFIEVNDGSCLKGVQIVAEAESTADYAAAIDRIGTGAAIAATGVVVRSKGKGQLYEIQATTLEVIGECDDTYPLQKKRHSLEFLRSIAHLRARTNTIGAIARVRSALAQATHAFFAGEGFHYVHTPLLTSSDCEGAGEMFRVSTLPSKISELPRTDGGEIDFAKDFFGKPTFLTVSGQLAAETYACALGSVYTFGPTFRAENSQTNRHLAEFHMIEPEIAFADLFDVMDNAEQYVKFVVRTAREKCPADFEFFGELVDKELPARLDVLINEPFERIPYAQAVELIRGAIALDPSKWEYPIVEFGTDLASEHERWLTEQHFKRPVFVYNYPREIKSFYMRDNEDGRTVAATDLLVPGVGELIGGSQREERLDRLRHKMSESGLNEADYWWYLDLRRFGTVPHAGYGLGFERLVCYVTATANIRDAIAFPRFPGGCEF